MGVQSRGDGGDEVHDPREATGASGSRSRATASTTAIGDGSGASITLSRALLIEKARSTAGLA